MSNFKDQEQAGYTADPAAVDLSVIIETYKALLRGDNLPERVAVQTVVLQTLLDAAAATTAEPVDVAAVREAISSVNIHDEANGYEWRGEGGDYTPKSHEKAMLEDFGHSLISQIDDAIRALFPAEPVEQYRVAQLEAALNSILFEDSDKSEQQRMIDRVKARAVLEQAEPVDQWQDITTIGEREHGRLIIVGTRDGKGRWCATIRRTTRVIEERNSSITGALKNTMRLKWEPTHFIELTALNSVAGR